MARWRGYFRPKASSVLGQPRPGGGPRCAHGFRVHGGMECPVCAGVSREDESSIVRAPETVVNGPLATDESATVEGERSR